VTVRAGDEDDRHPSLEASPAMTSETTHTRDTNATTADFRPMDALLPEERRHCYR
jgi:hypothetical protein